MEPTPPPEFTTETKPPETISNVHVESEPARLDTEEEIPEKSSRKPLRFWLVFISLLMPAIAANINATILSTVMPTIVRDIQAEERYIWINASYAIASAAIQPMLGQASNIYGRRYPMLLSLLLFTLGSGLSGGATTLGMLVTGRTIQGLGGGGIMMLMELIICDILPQQERPKYLGIMMGAMSFGIVLGPTLGGALLKGASWHWAFYISAPIGGVSLVFSIILLRLKSPANTSWKTAFARVDLMGNAIFISATCSMLVGLVMGGQAYPWSSFRVILPVVLGALGWVLFGFHQASPRIKEPTMPPRIFSNRTAVTGYFLAFVTGVLIEWITYYIPYYFQTLKGSSPLFSSVQLMPFTIFLLPAAAINGGIIAKTGKYKLIHFSAFIFLSLGTGLFSTMDSNTSTVKWVFWELFVAYGLGCIVSSTLPAIQSSLAEEDVATSTGVHSFLRSIGFVWGFTIPSLVFNGQISSNINIVSDAGVRSAIASGDAYSAGGANIVNSLEGPLRSQVMRLYTIGLRNVWYTALGFSLFGFVMVFLEKNIPLRRELQTDYGLEGLEEVGKDPGTVTSP